MSNNLTAGTGIDESYTRGSSNNILTYEEHKKIGSGVNEKYKSNPYKPIAIINGEFSPEECQEKRQIKREMVGLEGVFRLEDLNLDKNSKHYGEIKR